ANYSAEGRQKGRNFGRFLAEIFLQIPMRQGLQHQPLHLVFAKIFDRRTCTPLHLVFYCYFLFLKADLAIEKAHRLRH
ncbi:MAG: hypothetical protein N0C82_17350, partial [Candidatus Thiodiazotropha endolucinida]|nr:hypothetical protein [Candidatus Thiodiazotropha taylori]MCW4297078.1 hypothetical protein [Candidatus Thiodiazotropha endolucinida]